MDCAFTLFSVNFIKPLTNGSSLYIRVSILSEDFAYDHQSTATSQGQLLGTTMEELNQSFPGHHKMDPLT